MASLAAHPVLEERRLRIAVLSSEYRPEAAGVARETGRIDRAIQPGTRFVLVSGRSIPTAQTLVPGHRQFEEIPFTLEQEGSSSLIGADEVVERHTATIEVQSASRNPVPLRASG